MSEQLPLKKKARQWEDSGELEYQLQSFLNPVQPNPEFVTRLKVRLTTQPSVVVENRVKMTAFVVAASGLFAGAFLVWVIFLIRSLFFKESATSVS